MALENFADRLEASGLVSNSTAFTYWIKFFSDYSRFQAGNYLFESSVSPEQIAAKVIEGDTFEPVILQFTIPEGFTVKKLAARLAEAGVASEEEILKLASDPEFISTLGLEASSLEGFLYPATYSFTEVPDARKALSVPVATMLERLPQGFESKAAEKGLSLRQAVTIASLIELETALDSERSRVSEVIWNRLNSNMALAIDASVIYGIDNFAGNLRRRHLRDRSNLYNTRVHRGLPPTPIGSPSLASLKAVLNPSDEGLYYYVRAPEMGKAHRFSKNLKEHNENVRELVRAERKKKFAERRAQRAIEKRERELEKD